MSKKPHSISRTARSANPAYAEGMRQLRRSNAAGIHADKRTRRRRTRSAQRSAAIRENRE